VNTATPARSGGHQETGSLSTSIGGGSVPFLAVSPNKARIRLLNLRLGDLTVAELLTVLRDLDEIDWRRERGL
jgi:hypothetical protein